VDDFDADVIIVGAGPTGLMLAGELRLAGISALVLERLAEPVQQSRALGFSARAIEEFDQRGLLSRFGEIQTIPIGHFGGLSIDFRVVERGSYGARGVPQSRTEAILAQWATGLGAEVRRRHEVTGLTTADDDSVRVEVATPDGPQVLRAAYVVGCDGAHSTVRKLAGIDFPGTDPVIEMWLADLTGVPLRPRFSGERVPGGMVMVLPAGPGVFRIGLYEREAKLTGDVVPSFGEVAAAWQRLTGEDIQHANPVWISKFSDSSRQASEYRKGRVLVAGDAAHVHLPQGAQGMSAGIGDAMNLGWKLAAQLHGHAPAQLLDTYHTERHPVGERIIANTLAQRILYLGGDDMQPLRDLFEELLTHETVRRHLVGMVAGLDIRYDVGQSGHPLLGTRLPDHELVGDFGGAGKTTAFECLHAGRPVVFDLADDAHVRAAAAGWQDRVDIVTATAHAEAWTNLDVIDALLVRPDGYVAWVSVDDRGPAGLAGALGRWFGPPR
jgi:bifunctional hydroxylase/dehydrase